MLISTDYLFNDDKKIIIHSLQQKIKNKYIKNIYTNRTYYKL
jgi:hypothetical protein